MPEVTLREITPDNWMQVAQVERAPGQGGFVGGAVEILALAYVHRRANARALAICAGDVLAGLLLVEDMPEEPACYHLHELLIDRRHQRQGIGTAALRLLMQMLAGEGRFPRVEVCVHRDNAPALAFFQRLGFTLTPYIDPDHPWDRSLVCGLGAAVDKPVT